MSYEILEHTADAKFSATGDSLEEAFSETVNAFAEIVGGKGGSVRHSVELESESLDALLFDFIDELIFLQETEDVTATGVKDLEIEEKEDGYRLETTLWTDPIEPEDGLMEIKAPTYSEMEVDYVKGEGWKITAVMDI